MAVRKSLRLLLGTLAAGLLSPLAVLAECGGTTQCIGAGPTAAAAHDAHHGIAADSFTLDFGSQDTATTSAPRSVFVAAVTGPAGTMAQLGAATITGPNAADFAIAGGTCSTTNGPVHGGATCTYTVTFTSGAVGVKTATLNIPLNPPACVGCVTGRIVTLAGTNAARASPAQNAAVTGLLNSQAQTARRFTRAQIFNYQQRMESLHRWPAAGIGARSFTGLAPGVPALRPLPGTFERSAADSTPWGGTGHPGSAPGLVPGSLAGALVSAASTQSLNLSSRAGASASAGSVQSTGIWLGGTLEFGKRDQTSDSNAQRFRTDGVTVGVDRRFGDALALGMGVGYSRGTADVGTDGTTNRARATSVAVYSSNQPTRNTYVDALLGYADLSLDSNRFVVPAGDFARAQRKGDTLFASIAAGHEYRRQGLLVSPYARLDLASQRLDEVTETGTGANALTYFSQKLPARQLSLGVRAESVHETNFGWALPRLRLELQHEFEDARVAGMRFADQPAGPIHTYTPAGTNRNSLLLGLGSDFLFRSGLKLGLDYQYLRSFGDARSQSVRFWLAKELDGKRTPTFAAPAMFRIPINVDAGFVWDTNLNRARDGADRLSDQMFVAGVSADTEFALSTNTRLLVSGFANAEKFHTYGRLNRVSAGAQGELQYRSSGEFDAVTLGLVGRVVFDEYGSQMRTGYRSVLGITARQALTDRIELSGGLEATARHARSMVFDMRDHAARVNLDYSIGRGGAVYLGGEYRRGDGVSSARLSPAYSDIAKAVQLDDAFGTLVRYAYRYESETVLWTLGYNRALGVRDAIDLSLRRARSTPTNLGSGLYSASGPRYYYANQLSLTYLMRF